MQLIFFGIVRILRQQVFVILTPPSATVSIKRLSPLKLRKHLPELPLTWTEFQNDIPSFSRNLPTRGTHWKH